MDIHNAYQYVDVGWRAKALQYPSTVECRWVMDNITELMKALEALQFSYPKNELRDVHIKLTVAGGTPSSRTRPAVTTAIRTGTGSIDIAAATDVTLTNMDSVIYTAGIAGQGIETVQPTKELS